MAIRLSRRKLADYCADRLLAGDKSVSTVLAAYLVDTKRTREATLIVRDIEFALARRGVVVADVASAHELSTVAKQAVTSFIEATRGNVSIQLRTSLQPELLGGLKLNLPGQEYDATIRRKLTTLKARKV